MKKYIYTKRSYRVLSGLLDITGWGIAFLIRAILPERQKRKIKKIVVIELTHIGDVLADTPALRLLRDRFPDASISMVTNPWSKDIISGNPDIDEIIVYRPSWFDRIEKKSFSIKETIDFVRTLRKRRFDLGIDIRGDFRSILLLWLGRIRYRIGYGFSGGGFLLTDVVPFDVERRQDRHQIDHNLNLIKAIPFGRELKELQCEDRKLSIYFSDRDRASMDKYLEENAAANSDFLIALHSGSGLPSKCWPLERFASLIDAVLKRYKVKIVLVGGPEEVRLWKNIFTSIEANSSANDRLINAIGTTTIKQIAALLKRCSLFVGGDSGLMHIASAVGTPIVAIWGGHNKPSLWRPLKETDIVIHREVDCSPCGRSRCRDLKCLKQISVDDVLDGVVRQIERIPLDI